MALRDYLIRRVITSFVAFFLVVIANFFIFRLMPGNPANLYYEFAASAVAAGASITEEDIEKMAEAMGIRRPLHEQFFLYIVNSFTFQFLRTDEDAPIKSLIFARPIGALIMERLPMTILLLLPAISISIFLGMRLGAEAAWRRGSKFDVAMLVLSLFFYSMPIYWLGMTLRVLFASPDRPWFPLEGAIDARYWSGEGGIKSPEGIGWLIDIFSHDPASAFVDVVWHLVLPVTALVLYMFGGYFLLMRNTMLDVLTQDYITTARAIGHDDGTVIHKHAKRNAMLPMITVIVLAFAGIFSGAVLTETIFSWPGMGRLIFEAVIKRDYPVMESFFFMMALLVVIANLIADVIYGFLDPRIRY